MDKKTIAYILMGLGAVVVLYILTKKKDTDTTTINSGGISAGAVNNTTGLNTNAIAAATGWDGVSPMTVAQHAAYVAGVNAQLGINQ